MLYTPVLDLPNMALKGKISGDKITKINQKE